MELEGLREHLTSTENAIGRANQCLESIEISINERENEPPSQAGSEYAPSLPFESVSGHSAPSHGGETERRARVMGLQIEQAKREAQRRLEEERKRAENLEQERQVQEHRCIRELEYEVERLRLEALLDIHNNGKGGSADVESRLRDFEDIKVETVYCEIKPKISESAEQRENRHASLPQQDAKLPSPIKSSTACKQTSQIDQAYCDAKERLDVSWIKESSAKQSTIKGGTGLQPTPGFVKSIQFIQEPINRSLPLPYKPSESTFARIFLFLEHCG